MISFVEIQVIGTRLMFLFLEKVIRTRNKGFPCFSAVRQNSALGAEVQGGPRGSVLPQQSARRGVGPVPAEADSSENLRPHAVRGITISGSQVFC